MREGLFIGMLVLLAVTVALGQDAPGPLERKPDAQALKVGAAPKIDGKLDDAAWQESNARHVGVLAGWHGWGSQALVPQQRIGYVAWDETHLYVAMLAYTPDIFALASADNPFMADCLEVHMKLIAGEYYQLAIDLDANLGAGVLPAGVDLRGVRGATEFGENCWTAELAIPWKLLGVTPQPGFRMGFNLAGNKAYQGNGAWTSVTWGQPYFVKHAETVLELVE